MTLYLLSPPRQLFRCLSLPTTWNIGTNVRGFYTSAAYTCQWCDVLFAPKNLSPLSGPVNHIRHGLEYPLLISTFTHFAFFFSNTGLRPRTIHCWVLAAFPRDPELRHFSILSSSLSKPLYSFGVVPDSFFFSPLLHQRASYRWLGICPGCTSCLVVSRRHFPLPYIPSPSRQGSSSVTRSGLQGSVFSLASFSCLPFFPPLL